VPRDRTAFDDLDPAHPQGEADHGQRRESAVWIDDDAWCEADLPRRPWVAPGYALRGAVTVVAGPPSAMKSSLMLTWAAAEALGRPHGRFRPTAPGDVIIYNVEDDRIEQQRRLSAVLRQFDATPADIRSRIVRVGPTSIGTLFAFDKEGGSLVGTPAMAALRELVRERRPALLIADPLAELHGCEENDNTALRAVIAEFRRLAAEFDLAVILVHHTRKGAVAPGDPDSARGASSIIGAARIVLTLVTMSEEDAEAVGLPTDRKSRAAFVRLDDAKQNYAAIGEAAWYEKVLYTLDNGEAIPAAVPWEAPDMWSAIPVAVANKILDDIDAGLDEGHRYSAAHQATDRAAWRVAQRHVASLTEAQARSVIKTWLKNGVLIREDYTDAVEGKKRQGVRVNQAKRPG
jgi:hypothetical protein